MINVDLQIEKGTSHSPDNRYNHDYDYEVQNTNTIINTITNTTILDTIETPTSPPLTDIYEDNTCFLDFPDLHIVNQGIHNISGLILPDNDLKALTLGLPFCPIPDDLYDYEIIKCYDEF